MRALLGWTLAAIVLLSGVSQTRSAEKKDAVPGSAKEKLVGAWRLAWMEEPGPVGKLRRISDRKGMLLYSADYVSEVGVHSVQ
jgi:hypothetical protein